MATNFAECVLGWRGVLQTSLPFRNTIKGVACAQTSVPFWNAIKQYCLQNLCSFTNFIISSAVTALAVSLSWRERGKSCGESEGD